MLLKLTYLTITLIASNFLFLQCDKPQKTQLVLTPENHDNYFKEGNMMITPYIILSDKNPVDKEGKEIIIPEGIRYLDAVTTINPDNYAAYWIKGKGYQALEDHRNAYFQFRKSFELNKSNPDVARELSLECVYLGKGDEAVEVSLHALSIDSADAGLIGNVALAYLIQGDLNKANTTIKYALDKDPSDTINQTLQEIIGEVIAGKRVRPQKHDDIFN